MANRFTNGRPKTTELIITQSMLRDNIGTLVFLSQRFWCHPNGGTKCKWGGQTWQFSTNISLCISEMVQDMDIVTMKRMIVSSVRSIEWYDFDDLEWLWR